MRRALCTAAFGLAIAANANAFDMYRINGKIVERSMSASNVVEVAGRPDEVTKAIDIYGVTYGEFWVYHERYKTVRLLMSGGAVASVEETKR